MLWRGHSRDGREDGLKSDGTGEGFPEVAEPHSALAGPFEFWRHNRTCVLLPDLYLQLWTQLDDKWYATKQYPIKEDAMDVEEKDIPPILLRLFDEYRRARMNCLYYGARLRMITGCNRWAEIVLAITSSVTVASWYIWTTGPGMYIWMILGVLST